MAYGATYDPYGLYGGKPKKKATGTPYVPPSTQYQPPPQQQVTPPPQVSYGGSQYNQNYAAQQAAQARAQAEAAARAQQQASMAEQARLAMEQRKQMLAEQAAQQAAQQRENLQNQFDPYFVGQTMEDQYDSTRYGGVWGGLVDWFKDRWNTLDNMSMLPPHGTGRGFYPSQTVPHEYPWEQDGYYMTQQQINQARGQVEAMRAGQQQPAQQYLNPPGPRGQRGPYSPQDERQWAYDRDTNEQFQGVTKGYISRLLFGMPEQDAGGGGGGGGYAYPLYGGGGGGGYNFTPQEPTKSWYENMLNWNIG